MIEMSGIEKMLRDKNYLQNLSFELDGHRLRHCLELVDKLDASVPSDCHPSCTGTKLLSLSLFLSHIHSSSCTATLP